MEEEKKEGSVGKSLVLFLAGGIIGAVLAILYAPDSGEKTRQKVKEGADKAWQKARELEKNCLDRVQGIVNDIKSKVTQLVEEGKTLAEDKKKELLAAIEAGKKALEEEKKRIEEQRKAS